MPGHMGVIMTPFFFFFYTLLVAHSRPTDKDGVRGTLLYGQSQMNEKWEET